MIIMKNALRERIRRRELYIVVVIALLVLALCGSGAATLSIDGKPVTDFENMFGIIHVISNFTGCVLAVVLSLKTIPNEYERKTSHLVWIRKVSQSRYHFSLAAANTASALSAMGIFYIGIALYALTKGKWSCLPAMLPAFLMVCINLVFVSFLVSALSIVLPSFAAGFLGSLAVLSGVFHGILDIYKNVIGGFSGTMVKAALLFAPDLNGIQAQAQNLIFGRKIDIHIVLTGLLAIYAVSLGFLFLKRKEA